MFLPRKIPLFWLPFKLHIHPGCEGHSQHLLCGGLLEGRPIGPGPFLSQETERTRRKKLTLKTHTVFLASLAEKLQIHPDLPEPEGILIQGFLEHQALCKNWTHSSVLFAEQHGLSTSISRGELQRSGFEKGHLCSLRL